MNGRREIYCWSGLLILLVMLGCRVIWLASRSETGLQLLARHWVDATIGTMLGPRTPVHAWEPSEQAQFWLGEVERTGTHTSQNAELAIGAALILDCPSPGFYGKYIKAIRSQFGITDLDKGGIEQAAIAFESICKERCLQLAATATYLEPANPDWWRLRALLLWPPSRYSYDPEPRDSDWLEVLEECAEHDSDNALYDYLAADYFWKSSSEEDFTGSVDRLVIKDHFLFSRGVEHFWQGQTKSYFAVGDAGFAATAAFLAVADVDRVEQPEVVNSRTIRMRSGILLRGISRRQGLRADEEIVAGNVDAGLKMHRENLHLYQQFAAAGPSAAHDDLLRACRNVTTSQMQAAADARPDVLSADEVEEIGTLRQQAQIDDLIVQRAAPLLPNRNLRTTTATNAIGDPWIIGMFLAVSALASFAVAFFLMGAAVTMLTCWVQGSRCARIGIAEQLLAFMAAIAVTTIVFGLAPARIISDNAQAWALTTFVLLAPLLLTVWIVWAWFRPNRLQYSLRTLFKCFSVVCLLLTMVTLARPIVVSLATFPFRLEIPPLGWYGWNANVLKAIFRPWGSWLWALVQWTVYLGPTLTVAIWACFVAALLAIRLQFQQSSSEFRLPTFKDRVATLCSSLGKPALLMGTLAFIVYLVLVPNVVDFSERQFQTQMAYARRPDEYWIKVDRALQDVRGNAATMKGIEDSVNAESEDNAFDAAE